ncbi:hypothetical protein [Limimaricola pyoseonensis]|uniref:DUF1127 domain-containing protein n=1 Tax=Limimaricola pyoseonensis TaxID=521013 RepID=A0A1G7HQ96_9RHOB|nr:hypothetical protein [Limimaricola pyoseonensis]SDF02615.1 hypothetical protein SAMN04488567_3253 [Limimaricola pyoseonensis]
MAFTTTQATDHRNLGEIALAPLRAIFRVFVAMAESGPRMQQLRKLNETTDEELAAKGLTRAGEVQRIFGGSLYL